MVNLRKGPSKTSYVYRYQSLSSLEQMEQRRLTKGLCMVLCLQRKSGFEGDVVLPVVQKLLTAMYIKLMYGEAIPVRIRVRPVPKTIDSFTESQCYIRFMFTRDDLHRLHTVLGLDEFNGTVRMKNGSKFGTEEILLLSLNRFVFPQKFGEMTTVYGRDWTALCRAFNWFCRFTRINHSKLVKKNLQYWKPMLEEFSEAIRVKIFEKSEGGINHAPGSIMIAMFIDDTMSRSCRPGGGPAEEGENATRFNTLIQQSFYSGYKKMHGFKYQSAELPNGMCADLFGPCSIRYVFSFVIILALLLLMMLCCFYYQ